MKKGQLSVFLLLGLVIVIATAFLLYSRPSQEPIRAPDSFAFVEQRLQSCWENAALRATTHIGLYGGTLTPELLDQPGWLRVGVKNGVVTVPSVPELEKEIADATIVFAADCEYDVQLDAKTYGITLTPGTLRVTTRVLADKVLIDVANSHSMTLGAITKKPGDNAFDINTPLGMVRGYAVYLAEGAVTDGTLDVFSVAAAGVNTSIIAGPTSIAAVKLVMYETYPQITARWLLAFDQTDEQPRYGPTVKPVPTINAPADTDTSGLIVAFDPLGGPLTFTTSSSLLRIEKDTGVYSIRPGAYDAGRHPVFIHVTNERNITTTIATEVVVQ